MDLLDQSAARMAGVAAVGELAAAVGAEEAPTVVVAKRAVVAGARGRVAEAGCEAGLAHQEGVGLLGVTAFEVAPVGRMEAKVVRLEAATEAGTVAAGSGMGAAEAPLVVEVVTAGANWAESLETAVGDLEREAEAGVARAGVAVAAAREETCGR